MTTTLIYIAGLWLAVATTISLLKVLIVPRRAWSIVASPSLRGLVHVFHAVGHRLKPDLADRWLGFLGPLYVIVLLGSFLGLYTVSFALLLAPKLDYSWSTAFRESGSSVFTLGFQSTAGALTSLTDIVAGATGMIVIALFIAYLPTLHAAIRDRERFVKLVQGRIGEPPASGVNILGAHFERGTDSMLVHLYREAERWAAGLSESHAKYPVLLYFRAPRSPLHWLSTMTGVADAAALHLALLPDRAPAEARAVIDAIQLCLRDLAHTARLDIESPRSNADDTHAMFELARTRLVDAGTQPTSDPAAAAHLEELRAGYHTAGSELASALAPPTPAGPDT